MRLKCLQENPSLKPPCPPRRAPGCLGDSGLTAKTPPREVKVVLSGEKNGPLFKGRPSAKCLLCPLGLLPG